MNKMCTFEQLVGETVKEAISIIQLGYHEGVSQEYSFICYALYDPL